MKDYVKETIMLHKNAWVDDRGLLTYWIELDEFSSDYRTDSLDIRLFHTTKGYCGRFFDYYTRCNHNVAVI